MSFGQSLVSSFLLLGMLVCVRPVEIPEDRFSRVAAHMNLAGAIESCYNDLDVLMASL